MLFYTGLFFLVIAVSIDGFGVGVTYGMRKIRVPLHGLCIIMLCSGIVVLLSMTIGTMLSKFISADIAKSIGGSVLIVLGAFSLINVLRSQISKQEEKETEQIPTNRLQKFKTVLTTPDKADLDRSGIISTSEAILLGSALALDAFGAGLAAAIIGYSPFITALLIAIMSGLFLFYGIKIGMLLMKNKKLRHMPYIPPILLITLGVINIF